MQRELPESCHASLTCRVLLLPAALLAASEQTSQEGCPLLQSRRRTPPERLPNSVLQASTSHPVLQLALCRAKWRAPHKGRARCSEISMASGSQGRTAAGVVAAHLRLAQLALLLLLVLAAFQPVQALGFEVLDGGCSLLAHTLSCCQLRRCRALCDWRRGGGSQVCSAGCRLPPVGPAPGLPAYARGHVHLWANAHGRRARRV